ncbi:MAG: hypothetical protein ACI4AM_02800 [Muribaculaceae bacterium]
MENWRICINFAVEKATPCFLAGNRPLTSGFIFGTPKWVYDDFLSLPIIFMKKVGEMFGGVAKKL